MEAEGKLTKVHSFTSQKGIEFYQAFILFDELGETAKFFITQEQFQKYSQYVGQVIVIDFAFNIRDSHLGVNIRSIKLLK